MIPLGVIKIKVEIRFKVKIKNYSREIRIIEPEANRKI